MGDRIESWWYGKGRPLWPLWPLAWLFSRVARRRQRRLQARAKPLPWPVIVIGNITVGGTGKSPLTAWLAALLRSQGWHPVILSRGYGARRPVEEPVLVAPDSDPQHVGDEPVMLAEQTGCPVVVHPQRLRSASLAIEKGLGDIFICDDGLQHYFLARDMELAVFDGSRGIGNGAPIPVGPLREPPARVADMDFVVVNGAAGPRVPAHPRRFTMSLEPVSVRNLVTGERHPPAWLQGQRCRAIAGIGNPGRFFAQLEAMGAEVEPHAYADHHSYTKVDISGDNRPLLMTAKDAVKIRSFAHDRCWVLDVEPRLPDGFAASVSERLEHKLKQRGATPVTYREA